jgi:hypothetical protein
LRDKNSLTLTSGVEKGKAPMASATEELREEASYAAEEAELESLGAVRPSKSADTRVYLYAFDAHGKSQHEVIGDGSEYARSASCQWVTKKRAIWYEDPWLATMIARQEQGPSGVIYSSAEATE